LSFHLQDALSTFYGALVTKTIHCLRASPWRSEKFTYERQEAVRKKTPPKEFRFGVIRKQIVSVIFMGRKKARERSLGKR